jgi:hypothetical protein
MMFSLPIMQPPVLVIFAFIKLCTVSALNFSGLICVLTYSNGAAPVRIALQRTAASAKAVNSF